MGNFNKHRMKSSFLSTVFYAILAFTLNAYAQSADPQLPPTTIPAAEIVGKQAAIWVSIGLVLILTLTMCIMCRMDPDRSQDTIIYAKFIGNFEKPRTA